MVSQKAKLEKYVQEKQLGSTRFYSNNGFSEVSSDRPAFQKMTNDIEDSKSG